MAPLGVSCSLLREDQGLEVHSSALLDPFDSNWFMLCPGAMTFSQKLCSAPCPPVTSSAAALRILQNTGTLLIFLDVLIIR